MAKVRDYGSKKNTQIKAPEVNAGLVEYKMSMSLNNIRMTSNLDN